MSVTQLSVFIANKPGRLASVTRLLGQSGVNIRGFSIADTEDYGILRLLVDGEEKAREVLRDNGFTVHESQVILAKVPDRPGGFAEALDALAPLDINVEYTYATANSLIAFGVDNREKAEEALQAQGVRLLTNADLAVL
ncbi:MAG: ACT domain-containing protein [Armatimonadota bacterium]